MTIVIIEKQVQISTIILKVLLMLKWELDESTKYMNFQKKNIKPIPWHHTLATKTCLNCGPCPVFTAEGQSNVNFLQAPWWDRNGTTLKIIRKYSITTNIELLAPPTFKMAKL